MIEINKHRFKVSEKAGEISAILMLPKNAKCLLVLAHGAGAGMEHGFMEAMAGNLAREQVATFRYNFPYMEKGRRAPGSPKEAVATVKAAVEKALELAEGLPLLAGGKSYGGRMTSVAAAEKDIPEVKGLAYFGFPLHQMGKPSLERAEHLKQIDLPMLFLQGSKDKLADLSLIKSLCKDLGGKASLYVVEHGNHSFHVPKKSGKTDEEVLAELAEKLGAWADTVI